MNLALEVMAGGVRGGTSILYAGLGETVSERAGVVNLGIEGSMLCGALGAYAANAASGNPWIGALGGRYLGGRMAGRDGLFHGAVVGAIDVVALAILTTAASANVSNVVVDTVATIVSDVLVLALATMGGRLATRS